MKKLRSPFSTDNWNMRKNLRAMEILGTLIQLLLLLYKVKRRHRLWEIPRYCYNIVAQISIILFIWIDYFSTLEYWTRSQIVNYIVVTVGIALQQIALPFPKKHFRNLFWISTLNLVMPLRSHTKAAIFFSCFSFVLLSQCLISLVL